MRVEVCAPGKLVLLGEYAVLEGAPAIVMAVNRYALVIIENSRENYSIVDAPDINISNAAFTLTSAGYFSLVRPVSQYDTKKLHFFFSTLQYALDELANKISEPPLLNFNLDTADFFEKRNGAKLGLGSSAALTVALISALFKAVDPAFNIRANRNYLFESSLHAHRSAQANIGSGIDIAASVFGGYISYQLDAVTSKPVTLEQLTLPENLYILPVWSGKSASTRELVMKYNRFKAENPDEFGKMVTEMTAIAQKGCEAFKNGNVLKVLDEVNNYFMALKKLGEACKAPIVSPLHQQLAKIVHRGGGVYKPSGAGAADIGLAFCDSPDKAEIIKNRLSKEGFRILTLQPDYDGVKSITGGENPNG
ncbi:MAG: mevalonate kinase [Calditrichia bacterium]